jgi:hypothetical protein
MMNSPRRADARCPGRRTQGARIERRDSQSQAQTTAEHRHPQYSMLAAAAALACATAAHLDEEIRARWRDGRLSTRELALLLPVARELHEQLDRLVVAEGGRP